MAREPCLFVPGATYHVYCRVARGEVVFDDPYEAEKFVEKVREVRDADDWRILAWCFKGSRYGGYDVLVDLSSPTPRSWR